MTTNTSPGPGRRGGDQAAPAAAGGAPVHLDRISRAFGTVRALDSLTLDIEPGELVALLGPSGCGKTTALRILAGFESADSGTVTVDGKNIARVPAAKRDMGMVFQSYSLFPNMTALDNVGFGLRMRKLRAAARQQRASDLLDMVGLAGQARQYPHQLSGGQQQRVALARALAIQPRVLLLDEPLSALDAKVRLQLREQIRALQQRLGTTTLFVTHDQEEALSMADRVGVMRSGNLEQIATPDELYAHPATAFVAEFVGIMNRIPGGMLEQLGGLDRVTVTGSDGPPGAVQEKDALVRPEGLRVTASPSGNGIVTTRTFLGQLTRISVRLSGDLVVQVDERTSDAAGIGPGDSVDVSLSGAPVLLTERDGTGPAAGPDPAVTPAAVSPPGPAPAG